MKTEKENHVTIELSLAQEKQVALMQHLGEEIPKDVNDIPDYEEHGDYLVATDEEADDLWEQDLNNYIDDCILPELSKHYQKYFDRDAFISDAKCDGRGYSLGKYDGNENEEIVNGTTYYIYRQN